MLWPPLTALEVTGQRVRDGVLMVALEPTLPCAKEHAVGEAQMEAKAKAEAELRLAAEEKARARAEEAAAAKAQAEAEERAKAEERRIAEEADARSKMSTAEAMTAAQARATAKVLEVSTAVAADSRPVPHPKRLVRIACRVGAKGEQGIQGGFKFNMADAVPRCSSNNPSSDTHPSTPTLPTL